MTTSRTVHTADGRGFVLEEVGTGPPVVLQHGFPDTPASWRTTQRALADAGYRAVAPWLRGYHPDTWVEGRPQSPTMLARDLIDLIDLLGPEPAVVVGHDWGAVAGYGAASLAPDRLRGLVAIAIPHPRATRLGVGMLTMLRHFVAFKLPIGEWLARRNDFAYVETLFRRWSPSWDGPLRERTVADATSLFRTDPDALSRALGWYRAAPLTLPREVTARVPVPGMVFAGDQDWGGDPRPYLRSCDAFDAPCRAVVVEGAGHWPHLEDGERFTAELLRFLGELG